MINPKRRIIFLCFLIVAGWLPAQSLRPYIVAPPPIDPGWHGQTNSIFKTVSDSAGNTYVAYSAFKGCNMNGFVTGDDAHWEYTPYRITKLDSAGVPQWAMSTRDNMADLTVDSKGNVYVEICSAENTPRITATLPHEEIKLDSTYALLLKLSSEGYLLWKYQIGPEHYKPRVRVWTDKENNSYWLIYQYGWSGKSEMKCFDSSGKEKWTSRLSGDAIDAIEVSQSGETYYSGFLRSENTKPKFGKKKVALTAGLWRIDSRGREEKINSYPVDTYRKIREGYNYRFEHYINYISFTADNEPIFAFGALFPTQYGDSRIGGKVLDPQQGEFMFVTYDRRGQIKLVIQRKIHSTVYYDPYLDIGKCSPERNMGMYYDRGKWLFCVPHNTEWEHFHGYTELLVKNDMELFELDATTGNRTMWNPDPLLNYRYSPHNITFSAYNDSTILLGGLSTEPRGNVIRPYNIVYKLRSPVHYPNAHVYAVWERSSVQGAHDAVLITVDLGINKSVALDITVDDNQLYTVAEKEWFTNEEGIGVVVIPAQTWKKDLYLINVKDGSGTLIGAVTIQK